MGEEGLEIVYILKDDTEAKEETEEGRMGEVKVTAREDDGIELATHCARSSRSLVSDIMRFCAAESRPKMPGSSDSERSCGEPGTSKSADLSKLPRLGRPPLTRVNCGKGSVGRSGKVLAVCASKVTICISGETGQFTEGIEESEDMERAMSRTIERVERSDMIFTKHLNDVGKR